MIMTAFSATAQSPATAFRAILFTGFLLSTLLLGIGFAKAQSGASPETSNVFALQEGLLEILNDPAVVSSPARTAALGKLVGDTFDINAMGAIAVGVRTYATWSEAQRDEFLIAFARFMVATHANRFVGATGQRFDIEGSEATEGGRKIVHAQYHRADQPPFPIDYLVQPTPAGWRILDVYLDGTISLLALHRSEFSSVLRDRGFAGFIAAMHAKADEIAARPTTN